MDNQTEELLIIEPFEKSLSSFKRRYDPAEQEMMEALPDKTKVDYNTKLDGEMPKLTNSQREQMNQATNASEQTRQQKMDAQREASAYVRKRENERAAASRQAAEGAARTGSSVGATDTDQLIKQNQGDEQKGMAAEQPKAAPEKKAEGEKPEDAKEEPPVPKSRAGRNTKALAAAAGALEGMAAFTGAAAKGMGIMRGIVNAAFNPSFTGLKEMDTVTDSLVGGMEAIGNMFLDPAQASGKAMMTRDAFDASNKVRDSYMIAVEQASKNFNKPYDQMTGEERADYLDAVSSYWGQNINTLMKDKKFADQLASSNGGKIRETIQAVGGKLNKQTMGLKNDLRLQERGVNLKKKKLRAEIQGEKVDRWNNLTEYAKQNNQVAQQWIDNSGKRYEYDLIMNALPVTDFIGDAEGKVRWEAADYFVDGANVPIHNENFGKTQGTPQQVYLSEKGKQRIYEMTAAAMDSGDPAMQEQAIALRDAAESMSIPKESIRTVTGQRAVEARAIRADIAANISSHGASKFNARIMNDIKGWAAKGGLPEGARAIFTEEDFNKMVQDATGMDVINDLLALGYNRQQVTDYLMKGSYFGTSKESAKITKALMDRRIDQINSDVNFTAAWDSVQEKLRDAAEHNLDEVELNDVEKGALEQFGKVRLMQKAQDLATLVDDVRSLDSDSTAMALLNTDNEVKMMNIFGPGGAEIIRTSGRTPLEKAQRIAEGAERDLEYGLKAAAMLQKDILKDNVINRDDLISLVNPQIGGTSDPLDIVSKLSRSEKLRGATGKKILGNTEVEQDYKNRNVAVILSRLGALTAAWGTPLSRQDEMAVTFGMESPQYEFARNYNNGQTAGGRDLPFMLRYGEDEDGNRIIVRNDEFFNDLRDLRRYIDEGIVPSSNYQELGTNSHLSDHATAVAVNQLGAAILKSTAEMCQYLHDHDDNTAEGRAARAALGEFLGELGLERDSRVRLSNGQIVDIMTAVQQMGEVANQYMDSRTSLRAREVQQSMEISTMMGDRMQGELAPRDVASIARLLVTNFGNYRNP